MRAMECSTFAELLRGFRHRHNLTQEELAERAQISPAAISLLKRGLTHAPQQAIMRTLSAALELAPEEAAAFLAAARRLLPQPGGADRS